MKKTLLLMLAFFMAFQFSFSDDFSVEEYHKFLKEHEDISSKELYELYPPGEYLRDFRHNLSGVDHFDDVDKVYKLTDHEMNILEKQSFMVTSRLSKNTHWEIIEELYYKDLPLFVSTDMILHAFHKSYDEILIDMERTTLYPNLEIILNDMHDQLTHFADKYQANEEMMEVINDMDVFLSVPAKLLSNKWQGLKYNENLEKLNEIIVNVGSLDVKMLEIFGKLHEQYDYSQFKVRGHYEGDPMLERYFQAMIWLGRTELYLEKEKGLVGAMLFYQMADKAGVLDEIKLMDDMLKYFIGDQDNVSYDFIGKMIEDNQINDLSKYLNKADADKLRKYMKEQEFPGQKILSQVIIADPFSDKPDPLPATFVPMGQRFIIDSYMFHNLVYDRIVYKNEKIYRGMPNTYEILFCMGNDAIAHFLKPDLDEFHYSDNLAALRYLVDSYDEDFWSSSIYNNWLNLIKQLSPPSKEYRESLPGFMQTAAWWQHKANTQLASWSQLRHDNLLYAKQSYTSDVTCEFPHTYVEPEVDFWNAFLDYCNESINELTNDPNLKETRFAKYFIYYLGNIKGHIEKLRDISIKELNKEKLTDDEVTFLRSVYKEDMGGGCGGPDYSGWYVDFFYSNQDLVNEADFIIADVHTEPALGAGYVKHVATGKVNMAFIIAKDENSMPRVYLGPVMSYYEMTTSDWERKSDSEWEKLVKESNDDLKPREHTQLYLCDNLGLNAYTNPPILPTYIDESVENPIVEDITIDVYPLPAKDNIYLRFDTDNDGMHNISVSLYDLKGNKIAELIANNERMLSKQNNMIKIDISKYNLISGFYLLQMNLDSKIHTANLVIEK